MYLPITLCCSLCCCFALLLLLLPLSCLNGPPRVRATAPGNSILSASHASPAPRRLSALHEVTVASQVPSSLLSISYEQERKRLLRWKGSQSTFYFIPNLFWFPLQCRFTRVKKRKFFRLRARWSQLTTLKTFTRATVPVYSIIKHAHFKITQVQRNIQK